MNFRKSRTNFNPHQLSTLEDYYSDTKFPKSMEREQIAHKLGLSTLHVQVWFQNKRAKEKRKKKKQALVSSKKFVPKPPSFWPNNIPFSSKITDVLTPDVLKQNRKAIPASSSSSTSSHLSSCNVPACPTTVISFSELPVTDCDRFPLPDQPSSLDVSSSGYSKASGPQSSKGSCVNMYQPHLDFEATPQRGSDHESLNGFLYGSDYLHHMDRSLHYCVDDCICNSLEDGHQMNRCFGTAKRNLTSNSSVPMKPVNDSLNPGVLELMTRSTYIESASLTAIGSPNHSRHALGGDELPESGNSQLDFLVDNASSEFSTSQHCHEYNYGDNDHMGYMTEQQAARHSERTQPHSSIAQWPTTVEATLHAPMLP